VEHVARMGEIINVYEILKGRDNLKDQGLVGRRMLERILHRQCVICAGFI